MMVTSDFRLRVEIRPLCTCAIKHMQHNPYLWPKCQNFSVLKEIRVEEHDSDVRFKSGSEIWPFRACTMHPAIIVVTVQLL